MMVDGSRDDRGGTREDTRPVTLPTVSVRRLMLRFFLTGLAAAAILAAATALVSRRVGTDQAMSEAQRVTNLAASGIVQDEITPALMRGEPAALSRMDRVIHTKVLRGSLVRTKIWTPTGRVVYSDESRLIGERFELGDDALAVLAGSEAHAEITNLSRPENQFETPGTRLLEVYAPLKSPTETPLLFEVYFSYTAVSAAGRSLWLSFAPVALGALLLLQLLQLPSAWSLATRLRRGQEAREQMLHHAIASSDAERRRIAGDLHDGAVQDLAGVSFALSAAARRTAEPGGPPIDRQEVERAASQVRGVITSLRSLLVEIYPPNLTQEGLDAALNELVAGLPARGITPSVSVGVPHEELRPDTLRLLYRSAQEIVRNAVRHGAPEHITIRVERGDERISLRVEDDGRGFDPRHVGDAAEAGHVGLRGLGDLVSEAGGSIELASAPGRGTIVTVEVPR